MLERASSMNRSADVDPVHGDAALGQGVRVSTRTTPHVEYPHAGREREGGNQELDLLAGALRERVSQVRRPEVVGDRSSNQ